MNLSTESELATLIMISNNESNDRLDRLMQESIIYSGTICGNWHYCVRVSLDVDACDQIFWNGKYIQVQRNYWVLYMCVYYEDDFQFAIPAYTGIEGHADQYALGSDSGKLDSTIDCKDVTVQYSNINNNCDCTFGLSATQISRIYSIDTGEITSENTSTRSAICQVSSLLNGTSAGQESTPIIGKGIIYIDSTKKLYKDWLEAQS